MKLPLPLTILSLILISSACRAQDTAPATVPATGDQTAPSTPSAPASGGHHHPDFMSQIDLTPDQQSKIDQIKANVTDKKERHDQIQAVLTPEQKEKLSQLMKDWRAAHPKPVPAGGDSSATPPATPSPAPAQ